MSRVMAVVGAQWGSEGKGLVVEKIAHQYDVHVRTGAPNAGHTYYVSKTTPSGLFLARQKVVARSVPVGAANRNAKLVVGVGALIDLDLLIEEVKHLDAMGLDVSSRLMVDDCAMLIDPIRHHHHEGGVDGNAHAMIGSTGEGVGPARMARISRGTFSFAGGGPAWARIEGVWEPQNRERLEELGVSVGDTALLLNNAYDQGASILLEGTQGSALSLLHGEWPYVTSNDTNAAQLAADCGLSPRLITRVMLVARAHPIRVAGNSGPLPHETGWAAIGQPEEMTTVTKKVRRVGLWSSETVRRAVMLNRATEMALMFVDYVSAKAAGVTSMDNMPGEAVEFAHSVSARVDVPVSMLGTGPDTVTNCWIDRRNEKPVPWPSRSSAYVTGMPDGH